MAGIIVQYRRPRQVIAAIRVVEASTWRLAVIHGNQKQFWDSVKARAANMAAERPGWTLEPGASEDFSCYFAKYVTGEDGRPVMTPVKSAEDAECVILRYCTWAHKA